MWLVALVALGLVNGLIVQKELNLAQGQSVYLELAPIDPRSLIQGDYMVLRYAIVAELSTVNLPEKGLLVLTTDKNKVAHFQRVYQVDEPLAAEEVLLIYHKRGDDVWLGTESFFFQEGQANYYRNAHYAELKITDTGENVLVGLRGENFEPLGPP